MQSEDVGKAMAARLRDVVLGQDTVIELMLAALAARSHVLLEGPPGTAKTLLAFAVAKSVGLDFRRAQMTPDLLPSDLLGTSVWLPSESRFDFRAGPIFTDVLLADELNRAPPKTQAALLEAMQERQVTQDGTTRSLSRFFWVLATQNPLEHEGTYPLPESQLDRFGLKIAVDYPSAAAEQAMLVLHRDRGEPLAQLATWEKSPVEEADLVTWQEKSARVHVADPMIEYIQTIVRATRTQPDLAYGAGPRAAVSLLRLAQGLALVRGRAYVIPDDVKELVVPVLEHRVRLAPEAQIAGLTAKTVLGRLLAALPVPVVHAA